MRSLTAFVAGLLLASCGGESTETGNVGDVNGPAVESTPAQAETSAGVGLYPGAQPAGAVDRFQTADPVDKVVAWYRDDAARRAEMMFVSSEKRDDGYLVLGTAGEEGTSFALLLTPAASGGTAIQALPYDPKKGLKL